MNRARIGAAGRLPHHCAITVKCPFLGRSPPPGGGQKSLLKSAAVYARVTREMSATVCWLQEELSSERGGNYTVPRLHRHG